MRKQINKKIAVLIPCYNEEKTIESVVRAFKWQLPDADIYVYDNNSKDNTAALAKKSGAIVIPEPEQGKGNVVRSMFRDIDADIYVMVDGDDTYPADEVKKLIEPVLNKEADMVIGDRLSTTYFTENKKLFHNFGNKLVKSLINSIYNTNIKDIMTGYRALSKRFAKAMPIMSSGFQIETEMTLFALKNHFKIVSKEIEYRDRPEGSFSKINTIIDGIKIVLTIYKDVILTNPTYFFACALPFIIVGLFYSGVCLVLGFFLATLGVVCSIIKGYHDEQRATLINHIIQEVDR